MTRTSRWRLYPIAVLFVAAGCATTPPAGDPFAEAPEEDVYLTVRNNERRPATIYAYWNGVKERVGSVTASGQRTFTMKWKHEEVRIGYELLGRRALPGAADYVDGDLTGLIEVWGGDHLDLVIQPQG